MLFRSRDEAILAGRDRGEDRFVAHGAVSRTLQEVLPLCDLIVGTEEEIHILGASTVTLEALRAIRAKSGALLVCKRGAEGCIAYPGAIPATLASASANEAIGHEGFAVEVFNVLGAGDAFMAGFLRGWLTGEPLEKCCAWANACGAIVVSRHGCAPAMPTWTELQRFLATPKPLYRLRDDTELEHLHWATTRARRYDELTVLAIDHRSQFEDLAHEFAATDEQISSFKSLALRAVDAAASGDVRFGILLDGRYGFDALAQAAERPYWLGRPIEIPRSRPLRFVGSADVATELSEWPINQVVKCLVHYHPDEPSDLRERQERQLQRLFDACRKTRHELLIEVILPADPPSSHTTVARAIRRLNSIGIRPDWWKLEPAADSAAWHHIESAIQEGDPHCRGVVMLGLSAPEAELIRSFEAAAAFDIVKGFAVGRTIFFDTAREWLAKRISDDEAVVDLASKLTRLVEAWRRVRGQAKAVA